MKRIFFAIVIVLIGLTAFAADPPGTKVPIGLVVGAGKTKTAIDTTELKRIKDIDDKIDNSTLGSSLDEFYNKTQSNTRFINEDGDTITGIINVPTPTAGTNTTQAASTGFVVNNNNLLNDLKDMGMSAVAIPIGWLNTATATETMVDGDIRGVTIVLRESKTITGYSFVLSTAGVYTGDNVNGICLYSKSGTTLTKVAGSEITDTNMWTVANLNQKPLSTPITLTAGEYKLAFIYNNSAQTTAPVLLNLGTHANSSSTKYLFTNADFISFKYSSQTSLVSSVSTSTLGVSQHIPAIWLY